MIRRDAKEPDGSPAWILISQVEHAQISAELAAAWGGASVEPLPFPEVLVPTIRRHDDGWREWEARPEIEPTHRRPYNFLEIPAATAHAIWSASIEDAADLGPLAQATIAGHFVELRRRHPGHDAAEAKRFLDQYESRIQAWRREWQAMSPANTAAAADRALAALQFFDAWSLWLCCSAATTPFSLRIPDQFAVELTPSSDAIAAKPWPFRADQLSLTALGREVPEREYRDAEDLAQERGTEVKLTWHMAPSIKDEAQ